MNVRNTMRAARSCRDQWPFVSLYAIVVCGLLLVPFAAQAQTAGNNAVYNSSGNCCAASSGFIDASVISHNNNNANLCATIYSILSKTNYPAFGEVIDARGITGSALTCAAGTNPWWNGTAYQAKPSVLLLPAGTINIFYTWILPNTTKIVGQGASNTGQTGTVLAAGSGFSGPNISGYPLSILQFGDSNLNGANCGPCFRISVEDLTLNASAVGTTTVDGILNLDSQELTYARRISMLGITGTGIQNGDSSSPFLGQNAGPYEQIYYSSHSPTGTCAQIYGSGMRGIHGITCIGNVTTPISHGAILADSSSNSIEDVNVNGFTDGVLLGSQPTTSSRAWGNVLFNVTGGSAVTNVVHLCGLAKSGSCIASSIAVQDTSIVGVTSGNPSGTSINDEATGVSLTDTYVGMYALGEPLGNSYSRFTTSPSVPSWFVGNIIAVTDSTCKAANGSIYSTVNSFGGGSGTAWACVGGQWHLVH